MRVKREIVFSRRDPRPFEIERMPLRQIERIRIAAERDRDSFEMRGVLSARRFPRLFFDLVNVYFFHAAFVIPTGVEESLTISVSSAEPVLSEIERARHDNWLLIAVE